jgi:hypothetical protein
MEIIIKNVIGFVVHKEKEKNEQKYGNSNFGRK